MDNNNVLGGDAGGFLLGLLLAGGLGGGFGYGGGRGECCNPCSGFSNEAVVSVNNAQTAGTSTEYKTKWDLGDIVTVISKKYNKTLDLRITELTENYNADGFELTATLGDTETTISDALKRKFDEFEQLKTV